MNAQQNESQPGEGDNVESPQQQQHQPQGDAEGHAGQGAESAMKQMRVWEQRRASNSGGKRRQGP